MDQNENTETATAEETMSVGKVIALIAINVVVRVVVTVTAFHIINKLLERSAARQAKKALKND